MSTHHEMLNHDVEHKKQFNIYRFKFSDNIICILREFAKLHQFDDRITFKESWSDWIKIYDSQIEKERKRLEALGYTSDILSKMFKSTRYYFKKKLAIKNDIDYQENLLDESEDSQESKELKNRTYISLDIGLLEEIDSHIKTNCINNTYTPALGWKNFSETYNKQLDLEIKRITMDLGLDSKEIINKIKKAYKNKYYQHTHKL